jgi:cation transport ATPase
VRFRTVLYLVIAVLFITGAAWVAVDRAVWPETATYLLRLHGGAAMAMLVLLGALLPLHVRVGWRRRRNRGSGALMVAANAILVATAFGLYYAGSDALRHWTSDLHIALGFALPLAVAGHVLRGRKSGRATRERPAGLRQGL